MWGSVCLFLQVGESQQTTHHQESLPASVASASSPAVTEGRTVPPLGHKATEDDGIVTQEALVVVTEKRPEGETSGHAPAKTGGHCHPDGRGIQRPSRSVNSQSLDVIPDDSAMDMLNKLEAKRLCSETLVDSLPGDNNETYRQQMYNNGNTSYPSLSNHSVSLEVEDLASTRHSSGCDDSGVFLEDLPYAPETLTNTAHTDSLERLTDRKSPEMRHYSIDSTQAGLDSDAERSDDLGLASSSIDSADDLDGDPLPSTLKIQPPTPSPKKPPPVPPRKHLVNGKCELQKDLESTDSKPDMATVLTPQVYSVHKMENNSTVSSIQSRGHTDNFKWKSEECLRSVTESKWCQRNAEKSISVKDRIAMFSEMESGSTPNKKEPTLHRFASENNVKMAPSVEAIDKKSEKNANGISKSDDFPAINRDTKWYSMYSLPLSSNISNSDTKTESEILKPSSSIPSLSIETTSGKQQESDSNNSTGPLKVETDHLRYSEKPIVSNYPQTQLTNNKRYSYGPYNLTPIRTTDDLLAKKNSSGGLLSIIDSRKQPLAKLKGLVIPEKPLQSPTSKALPTIVSNDSLILNSKTDVDVEKDWKRSMLSAASYKTMSLPRNRSELIAKTETNLERDSSKLVEPPWKANIPNGSILPKYSPAFKTRTLDLPHAVTSSLSPTPPSSITSPLSPPPSSPSSICSSNASSATSVATMQQNIFQFSLSHSKPVTPVLPEKPIMSPPSLPSDIEYEGDNSEDSSTSASPMISKTSSKLNTCSNNKPSVSSSTALITSGHRYEKPLEFSSNVSNGSCDSQMANSGNKYTSFNSFVNGNHFQEEQSYNNVNTNVKDSKENAVINAKSGDYTVSQNVSLTNANHQFCSTMYKPTNKDSTSNQRMSYHAKYDNGANNDKLAVNKQTTSPVSPPEISGSQTGNKNGFLASSQEVYLTKFRAQPLHLSQNIRTSGNDCSTVSQSKTHSTFVNEDASIYRSSDRNNFFDHNGSNSSLSDEQKIYISECEYVPSKQWSQSSELICFRKRKPDSEDEDDSHSSLSHRTEDSRPTTDEYFSDATTDSVDRSLDPDLKPRRLSQQKVVLKAAVDDTDSVQKFKALAEKWEHRADVKSPPPPPPPAVPAPRKEHKSYSAPIPVTSSFLSSIINSSTSNCARTNSCSTVTNPVKLPPSLMPRNKLSNDRSSDRKTNTTGHGRNSQKVSPSSSIKRDHRSSYEPIWCDSRQRKSSLSGSRDFSDSGSSTDTGSNYSRKITNKETWSSFDSLQNYRHPKIDKLSSTEQANLDDVSSLKDDNEVFISQETSQNDKDKVVRTPSVIAESPRDVKTETEDRTFTSTSHNEGSSLSMRKTTDTGEKSANSSNYSRRRRRSSFEKDIIDSSWINSGRDRIAELPINRNLSKSQASLRDPLESVRSHATSYFSSKNAKSVSVSDIRKAFETQCSQNQQALATKPPQLPPRPPTSDSYAHKQNGIHSRQPVLTDHKRLSSLDSTTSGDSDAVSPTRYGSVGSLGTMSRDPYGSVTSLASTTSLISPQELQQLIDEANQSLEDYCGGKNLQQEIQVVVLHREVPAGSIGITLAGGADYEVKEITVHKVISGSLADRDGRLRKGDRVISINGRNLKGITHREALDILKAPRPEVVLVIAREKPDVNGHNTSVLQERSESIHPERSRVREDFRSKSEDSTLGFSNERTIQETRESNVVCVQLHKDNTGFGFSIEGGKDSPLGDRPLIIKRIFKGGAADKDGKLDVGDEIISVNGQSVTAMTRTEAWNFLKKLPEDYVLVRARKQVLCSS